MSSIAETKKGAAAWIRVPVATREVLHVGGIVELHIPRDADRGTHQDVRPPTPYLEFSHRVRGGRVRFYLYTDNDSCVGTSVTAQATIMKKTLVDGRESLYVALTPVNSEPTCRLIVTSIGNCHWEQLAWTAFRTLPPLYGVIIFCPLLPQPGRVEKQVRPAPQAQFRKKEAGDPGLNQLCAAGWRVESVKGRTVHLSRVKDGKLRTMKYTRPK